MRGRVGVAVVGAGPAGSVFAAKMAALGHDVTLVEAESFPRSHLGESLTPGVRTMLASIGAAQSIEAAGCERVHAVATNWDGSASERVDPRAEGLLVDRGVFDVILLDHARRAGVRILQPAFVRRARAVSDGWVLTVERAGRASELHATFLADASGRASRLAAKREATGPSTIAVFGYWRGSALPRTPRIEARPQGWCWGVPIPDGSYNTLAFVDPTRVRGRRRGSLEAQLRELLDGTDIARDLGDAALVTPAHATDATPYVDATCIGPTRIRIGDAALALDPLSSSGVQRAIQTALSGAIVANTLLREPTRRDAALAFHEEAIRAAAERHRRWTSTHYATAAARFDDAFWSARSEGASLDSFPPPVALPSVDTPLRLSADAAWRDTPCLGAELVEVHRALAHPRLEGPVAFLGGHALADLLEGIPNGLSARAIARAWSSALPGGAAPSIVRWLIERGILEPTHAAEFPL